MKHKKVIAWANVPSRLPIGFTVTAWLFLDRLHVPGWAWGAAGVCTAFIWAASIYGMVTQETVDIFEARGVLRKDYE